MSLLVHQLQLNPLTRTGCEAGLGQRALQDDQERVQVLKLFVRQRFLEDALQIRDLFAVQKLFVLEGDSRLSGHHFLVGQCGAGQEAGDADEQKQGMTISPSLVALHLW